MEVKSQKLFFGYDSYLNIEGILKHCNVKKPFVVCDSAFDLLPVKDYLTTLNYDFFYFSDFSSNPIYEDIAKGVKYFRESKCDFVISIGGGSAIDVAKCIKLFYGLNEEEIYLEQKFKDNDLRHLAIPTTAGTGSESTKFAVCYYNGAKQSITHEDIIPDFAIIDPTFLQTLPVYQKKSTLLDALCQAIESLWSVNSNRESEEYSVSAITTILANLYAYMSGDKIATENIAMAANLAGRAINITQTTAAHAMSYKITSVYGISHGHAVAICLPYVWRFMINNTSACVDSRGEKHLEYIFNKLDEIFFVDDHKQAVYRFFRILKFLEIDFPQINSKEELSILINSVNPERLKNNPVKLDFENIEEIYSNVFFIGNKYEVKNIEKFLHKYHTTFEVKELQNFAFEALCEFDKFCKENNLKYFLTEGTLLGAVRHNGFIPWDDDVDVLMPREDYDRFIELSRSNPLENYVLDAFETNPKHWTICSKLLMKNECRFELKRLKGIALSTAPGIDVFALDTVPEVSAACNIGKKIRYYRVLLWLRTGYSHDYSTTKWKILKVLSCFYSIKGLHSKLQKLMKAHNISSNNYCVNYGSLYDVKREIFPVEYFSSTIEMNFEGKQFPVPKEYGKVLETVYGDYKKLPSYSKRFPKHSYFVNI